MKKFEARIEELRADLIGSIIEILNQNNLSEIELPDLLDDPTWVIWFDKNGYPYECRVVKVAHSHNHLLLSIHCQETDQVEDITSCHNLGAKNIDWLNEIRCNIIETLEKKHERTSY